MRIRICCGTFEIHPCSIAYRDALDTHSAQTVCEKRHACNSVNIAQNLKWIERAELHNIIIIYEKFEENPYSRLGDTNGRPGDSNSILPPSFVPVGIMIWTCGVMLITAHSF